MSNNILSCGKEDFFYLTETIFKHGNCIRFKAEGWSMSPSIKSGDIIKVSPNIDDITIGDIILYRSRENTPVVHRVVKMDNGNILTKGDSALDLDAPIKSEHVFGRVVDVERNGLQIKHVLSGVLHYAQGFGLYGILAKIVLRPQDITIKCEVSEENGIYVKWMAKKGGRIIGHVDLSPLNEEQNDKDSIWLMTGLWVHYRYRRIGLGRKLVKEALDYLSKISANEIRLYVMPANKTALRLYKDFGFAVIDNKHHNHEFREFIHLKRDVKNPSCHTS